MTLVTLRKVPRTARDWEKLHFNHFLDHKIILGVLSSKLGETLFMPPIWPVPGNRLTPKMNEFHQILHQQMNAFSGDNTYNFLNSDLSTQDGQETFVETNYKNHFAFHTLVGIPT